MAEIIKTIHVKDKEEAVSVMNRLTERYGLVMTDPENSLDVTNGKIHAYYESESKSILIETDDSHSVSEYIRELTADFPTFF